MIKISLVGYGYWGKIIRKYIDCDKRMLLKRIYTPNSVKDDMFTNDLNDLLGDSIDWVIIASPIDTHSQIAKLFLKKGINVLCEKPLSKNSKEVLKLIDLAKDNNCIIETNYIYLDSMSIKTMKQELDSIGDVLNVSGQISQYGKFYSSDGVVEIIGCHLFSTVLHLFGVNYVDVSSCNEFFDSNSNSLLNYTTIKYPTFEVKLRFSLIDVEKKRELTIYGQRGIIHFNMLSNVPLRVRLFDDVGSDYIENEYFYDEKNNLKLTMDRIIELTNHQRASNSELSYEVSRIIERSLRNDL